MAVCVNKMNSKFELAAILLVLSCIGEAAAQSHPDAGSATIKVISQAALDSWTKYSESLSRNTEQKGIAFSVESAPFASRILVTGPNGTETCSGALVGPSAILTAAHCFCPTFAKDGPEAIFSNCQSEVATKSVEVFLPKLGFFKPSSDVEVHQYYVAPGTSLAKPSPFADLAIVRVPIEVKDVAETFSGPDLGGSLVTTSFGHFTLASPLPQLKLKSKIAYLPGVQQLYAHGRAGQDTNCAPEKNQTDSICVRFDSGPKFDGEMDSATICSGDSGGALMVRRADASPKLVGVASYFWPAGSGADCNPNLTTIGVYTDIRKHSEWLSSKLNSDNSLRGQVATNQDCREVFVDRPGLYRTEQKFNYASTSVTTPRYVDAFPIVTLSMGPAADCAYREQSGLAVCASQVPEEVALSVPDDSAVQLVVCK